MLVLTRKIGEQVFIDQGNIQIKVLKADRGKISLGFEAPKNVVIDREEVHLRKMQSDFEFDMEDM